MGVLDVGAALPFEVEGFLPVKDRALFGRDLHDIVPDGGKPDRTGNGPPRLLVKFRPPYGHFIKGALADLGDEVIGRDELPGPGAHRALRQGDKLEVDDLRDFLAKQFHRALELCPDELVIGTEHIDDPVEIRPFPCMECEVAGCIDRGAVAPADDILVLETRTPRDRVRVSLRPVPAGAF